MTIEALIAEHTANMPEELRNEMRKEFAKIGNNCQAALTYIKTKFASHISTTEDAIEYLFYFITREAEWVEHLGHQRNLHFNCRGRISTRIEIFERECVEQKQELDDICNFWQQIFSAFDSPIVVEQLAQAITNKMNEQTKFCLPQVRKRKEQAQQKLGQLPVADENNNMYDALFDGHIQLLIGICNMWNVAVNQALAGQIVDLALTMRTMQENATGAISRLEVQYKETKEELTEPHKIATDSLKATEAQLESCRRVWLHLKYYVEGVLSLYPEGGDLRPISRILSRLHALSLATDRATLARHNLAVSSVVNFAERLTVAANSDLLVFGISAVYSLSKDVFFSHEMLSTVIYNLARKLAEFKGIVAPAHLLITFNCLAPENLHTFMFIDDCIIQLIKKLDNNATAATAQDLMSAIILLGALASRDLLPTNSDLNIARSLLKKLARPGVIEGADRDQLFYTIFSIGLLAKMGYFPKNTSDEPIYDADAIIPLIQRFMTFQGIAKFKYKLVMTSVGELLKINRITQDISNIVNVLGLIANAPDQDNIPTSINTWSLRGSELEVDKHVVAALSLASNQKRLSGNLDVVIGFVNSLVVQTGDLLHSEIIASAIVCLSTLTSNGHLAKERAAAVAEQKAQALSAANFKVVDCIDVNTAYNIVNELYRLKVLGRTNGDAILYFISCLILPQAANGTLFRVPQPLISQPMMQEICNMLQDLVNQRLIQNTDLANQYLAKLAAFLPPPNFGAGAAAPSK
jgi:hypothetical protein